jgi:hypothetical protein
MTKIKNNSPLVNITSTDQVKFVGDGNKQYRAFLWGCKDPSAVPTNTAYIAEFDKSDFGFSTNQYKLRKIEDPN